MSQPPTTNPQAAKPTVLLVEDDLETQALMKLVLRRSYDVIVASSAAEARALLAARSGDVQLILMDFTLRGSEDGLALTRYLRAQSATRKTPIIAATARSMPQDRLQAYAAGCDAYLTKPFYPRQMLTVIERYLQKGN
jgi:CheY-like chemotaxis protein